MPNLNQRIAYILNLFPSELHILVRPEIQSLADLRGRKVNFNTPGTAAAYSGPLIFDRLRLPMDRMFVPHPVALEQMRRGEGDVAAVVFVTTKPGDAFTRGRWDPGSRFLPVDILDGDFVEAYLPSTLTSRDYPLLIPEGQSVATIAVPAVLAAYNWTPASDRFNRLVRFVDHLYGRIRAVSRAGLPPGLARREHRRAGAGHAALRPGAGVDRPRAVRAAAAEVPARGVRSGTAGGGAQARQSAVG